MSQSYQQESVDISPKDDADLVVTAGSHMISQAANNVSTKEIAFTGPTASTVTVKFVENMKIVASNNVSWCIFRTLF